MKKITTLIFLACYASYGSIRFLQSGSPIQLQGKSWLEMKNKNLTRQKEDFSCGSASLSTILTYFYHIQTPEVRILSFLLHSKGAVNKKKKTNGLSFTDLSQYISYIKFKPIALAIDIYTLKKLKVPAILYLEIKNNKHFTVYKGSDQKYIYLADPSFGNIKISLKKFQEIFYNANGKNLHAGMILALLPQSNKIKPDKTFMRPTKRYSSTYTGLKLNLFR